MENIRYLIPLLLAISFPSEGIVDQSGIKKIQDRISEVRHEVRNHEAQLSALEGRIRNQEETLILLQRELDTSSKEKKGNGEKAASYETSLKGLGADLRQLQTHANQASSALELYQKRIAELENKLEKQSRHIDSLKEAMRSLMQVVKGEGAKVSLENETESTETGAGYYKVQSGDSLGAIAQKFHTTIRELKEINALKNNNIFVGQKLKVPQNEK